MRFCLSMVCLTVFSFGLHAAHPPTGLVCEYQLNYGSFTTVACPVNMSVQTSNGQLGALTAGVCNQSDPGTTKTSVSAAQGAYAVNCQATLSVLTSSGVLTDNSPPAPLKGPLTTGYVQVQAQANAGGNGDSTYLDVTFCDGGTFTVGPPAEKCG